MASILNQQKPAKALNNFSKASYCNLTLTSWQELSITSKLSDFLAQIHFLSNAQSVNLGFGRKEMTEFLSFLSTDFYRFLNDFVFCKSSGYVLTF